MSAIEYNNLLFKISQRLNELNVGRRLLVMCRGKVAPRDEENMQDVFPLFVELEQNGFLGADKLNILKDLLKGLEEWSLFGNVKSFESKRKDYNSLLERTIHVLDELDCLEQLVAICNDRIPEEKHSSIQDVRSLFQELENNDSLGIDHLEVLKEILTRLEKTDLLREVEEFEDGKNQEEEFEWRKAQAAAIASSASSNLAGVLNIKTLFKVAAGGTIIASAYQLLRRGCTYDQFVTAVNTCVLPAGVKLLQIAEGSVILKVQAENISALNALWCLYTDGTLKESLQTLFFIDELREFTGEEQVEVIVTIDEEEYDKAREELIREAQGPVVQMEEWQEKVAYIQSYLAQTKDIDTQSFTTETSDSGISRSHAAPSELGGPEETSDTISNLCLKDLDSTVTEELARRLRNDLTALRQFCKAFGLDPEKLNPNRLQRISELFPDTPIKLLRDVFEELQLHDLVEFLEKVKPRTLRLSVPLEEVRKFLNASERPTKFYSKAEVLIIAYTDKTDSVDACFENIGSFFERLHSESQITEVTVNVAGQLDKDLNSFRSRKETEEANYRNAKNTEATTKELLEKRLPRSLYGSSRRAKIPDDVNTNKQLLIQFFKEEPGMKSKLQRVIAYREQRNLNIEEIEEKIKQKEDELQGELEGEKEKFEMAVSSVMDKWICQAKAEDNEPTLFVVLLTNNLIVYSHEIKEFSRKTRRYLTEKLALIPSTKLLITDIGYWLHLNTEEPPQETLHLHINERGKLALATIFELLNQRWQTLDLISVFREVQRTLPIKKASQQFDQGNFQVSASVCDLLENLSCLPRLQKTEL
ncbi:unnamed protein product [Porites evermanni]|uniref:DED domain-containing protein n=1 Tax=Porites evermanni TaxID=104178 RepID=A0ABN8LK03_9CNID|nr:unnamed protein product [Porites evermanni]